MITPVKTYQGKEVTSWLPYAIAGVADLEIGATAQDFSGDAFTHNVTRPFAIDRFQFSAISLDDFATGNIEPFATAPSVDDMLRLCFIRVENLSSNQPLTKTFTNIQTLRDQSDGYWYLEQPFILELNNTVSITVTNQGTAAILGGAYDGTRLFITMEGALLTVGSRSAMT